LLEKKQIKDNYVYLTRKAAMLRATLEGISSFKGCPNHKNATGGSKELSSRGNPRFEPWDWNFSDE